MGIVYNLFSVPVFHQSGDEPASKNVIDFVKNLEYIDLDDSERSVNNNVLDLPELDEVKQTIQKLFSTYVVEVLCIDQTDAEFVFTNSWIHKTNPGQYAQAHNHANSLFSGIYFLDVPKKSGDIRFNHRNDNILPTAIELPFFNFNIHNSNSWTFSPNSGEALIFPSHLIHEVYKNESKKPRYSLAFNTFVRGFLGDSETSLNTLTIK